MDSNVAVEVVGYAASALIIVSITQKSILKLRGIGLAGSFTFLGYSLAIGAYPIAVVNVVAAAIHTWYLRKLIRRKEEVFRILHVHADSSYLLDFLDFYRDEIQGHFQPEFVYRPSGDQVTAFILRDMVPAGLLIGEAKDDNTFEAVELADIGDPEKLPLPVDISISSDDRFLFVDTFMDGMVRVFDVSNPRAPKVVYEKKIAPQVNMVSQTWDGNRIYFTSSLLANWDGTGGDDAQFLKVFTWDTKELTPAFEIDFKKEGLGRPHIMRFGKLGFPESAAAVPPGGEEPG
jgi:hypothetical protein